MDLSAAVRQSREALLAERNDEGHWEGELSTSALSTATALVALGCVDESRYRLRIDDACSWLLEHQNADGGWGDTTKSFSNISTTLLVWSALTKFGGDSASGAIAKASYWIRDYIGSLDPDKIAETVKARYGRDRTFSVPILMLCAICGTLGPKGWNQVLQMPFPLAAFPREWFAVLRLPVVSYALPALIAIGYARWRKKVKGKRVHPLWPRLSKLLAGIQPASGGFLEAAPLTSFVSMALVSAGEKNHPVVKKGVEFLLDTVREDGSWPIDTNLATWATTLSVKALATQQGMVDDPTLLGPGSEKTQQGLVTDSTLFDSQDRVLDWLLDQQYREVHPFTNSPPGGWAWTDLSGGVPDADDTPGALLALTYLENESRSVEILAAAEAGVVWLLDLQNRDGGIPTFCRGWGALPFDRSSPDLTAHTLRAWGAWKDRMPTELQSRIEKGVEKGIRFLTEQQRPDGSWMPLWFGNQHRNIDEGNPTYGTAMVVRALEETGFHELAEGGVNWLVGNQNRDGGWGSLRYNTPSSVEETALALSALAIRKRETGDVPDKILISGAEWLIKETNSGKQYDATPIGFYFAKLWYFERTYPVIWTHEALCLVENGIKPTLARARSVRDEEISIANQS